MGLFDKQDLSIFQVALINRGDKTVYTASSAITLVDLDGHEFSSMSIEDVASHLRNELKGSKGFDLMFREAHTVNPGETMPNLIAIFDEPVNWPTVKAFRVAVDGEEFEIDGRFLTAEEKAKLQEQQASEN
ncbi:MAG: hypothetical protein GY811_24980 [Myxococcales bacterium]|nr:hypothetical protein [Myxococcales bacterium]